MGAVRSPIVRRSRASRLYCLRLGTVRLTSPEHQRRGPPEDPLAGARGWYWLASRAGRVCNPSVIRSRSSIREIGPTRRFVAKPPHRSRFGHASEDYFPRSRSLRMSRLPASNVRGLPAVPGSISGTRGVSARATPTMAEMTSRNPNALEKIFITSFLSCGCGGSRGLKNNRESSEPERQTC